MTIQKAVFLDRDGVLNRTDVRDGKPFAPTRFEDFELLPDVKEATRTLKEAGFLLVVVTNQPDVGRNLVDKQVVQAMNNYLLTALDINCIKVCYHDSLDDCDCRKPKPGMLLEAASELGIDLENSFMVGDRKGDIEAGKAAGCNTIFLDLGYNKSEKAFTPDITVQSLAEAVLNILAYSNKNDQLSVMS